MIDVANLNGLLPLLQRLDDLLQQAVAAAQAEFGPETVADPYRGMHVDAAEVDRLLTRQPGAPAFPGADESHETPLSVKIPSDSRLANLQQTFGLSEFDLDVVAIALAPELDRRYERIYAYLQDDIRCKRPSIDLVLNLLCSTATDKLKQRTHFAPDAALIRHGLLHLVPDSNQTKSTLLAHELHLDEQIVRFLLHQPGLAPSLAAFCQLVRSDVSLNEFLQAKVAGLSGLVQQNWQGQKPLRLYFQGSDRPSQRQVAEALANTLNAPLLLANLATILNARVELEPTLKRLFREAWLQKALLYLDELDVLQGRGQEFSYQCLLSLLGESQGITILSGEQPMALKGLEPLGVVVVPFPMPEFGQRRSYWQQHLEAAGISLEETDINALADRFRLTSVQIADAIATACNTFSTPKLADFFAAARAQSGHDLGTLARKVEPAYTWSDIVLPADPMALLKELCNQAKYRHVVYGEWGFGRRLSLGKGLNVLFSGLPGTGKTMAAEVIANELQLDLYKIDLSQIVSKYIGETEKNLERIFAAATRSNAILLFDEADALFGKRSEVQDAHDRYANIEIGYLLQKMEEYEGIAILTTNLRSNMDDAFVRRLRFVIDFPLPDEQERLCIWEQILPDQTPCSPDLDFKVMARRFEISGANIRNIALAAAFLAASDGGIVTMKHLIWATQREYQKMGRLLMEEM